MGAVAAFLEEGEGGAGVWDAADGLGCVSRERLVVIGVVRREGGGKGEVHVEVCDDSALAEVVGDWFKVADRWPTGLKLKKTSLRS